MQLTTGCTYTIIYENSTDGGVFGLPHEITRESSSHANVKKRAHVRSSISGIEAEDGCQISRLYALHVRIIQF